jgi:hypothetical protein
MLPKLSISKIFLKGVDDFLFLEVKRVENLGDQFITQRVTCIWINRMDKGLRLHIGPMAEIKTKLTMYIARHFRKYFG